jgi:hypothetical protein
MRVLCSWVYPNYFFMTIYLSFAQTFKVTFIPFCLPNKRTCYQRCIKRYRVSRACCLPHPLIIHLRNYWSEDLLKNYKTKRCQIHSWFSHQIVFFSHFHCHTNVSRLLIYHSLYSGYNWRGRLMMIPSGFLIYCLSVTVVTGDADQVHSSFLQEQRWPEGALRSENLLHHTIDMP